MADHHVPAHARDAFTKDALKRIALAVSEAEKLTGAEIRVAIHDERDPSEAGKPIADVAKSEFAKLGMHKTKYHNGILLLVLYAERKFYVLADTGIHSKTNPEAWTDVARALSAHFHEGNFEEGVSDALRKIAHHAKGAVTKNPATENELSDDVVID